MSDNTQDAFDKAATKFFGDMMLNAINNQHEVVAELMAHMALVADTEKGMLKYSAFCKEVIADYDNSPDGPEEAEFTPRAAAQMIQGLCASVKQLATMNRHLACLCLVYAMSNSFQPDAARAAGKFGKGKQAMRDYVKSKFGGAFGGPK